jgi:hypothetical protein
MTPATQWCFSSCSISLAVLAERIRTSLYALANLRSYSRKAHISTQGFAISLIYAHTCQLRNALWSSGKKR